MNEKVWKSGPAPQEGAARVWHKGPPPHIGWWNASRSRIVYMWRWWDGAEWSIPACEANFAQLAFQSVPHKDTHKEKNILWTDYYPEGARVPRVDPSDPKNLTTVSVINMTTSSTSSVLWEDAAWEMYRRRQAQADAAAAGSTRTVRYEDVDFSGAQLRNTTDRTGYGFRRTDKTVEPREHLRSNGQLASADGNVGPQNPERREIGDPFHGVNTMALMRELFRRFNAAP